MTKVKVISTISTTMKKSKVKVNKKNKRPNERGEVLERMRIDYLSVSFT
jgi:hypothetical protein